MGVDVFILVYVDDLLIISDLVEAAEQVQEEIIRTFKAREMGEPTYFLDLHVDRDAKNGSIYFGQRQYVANLLERFGLQEANPVKVLIGAGAHLRKEGESLPQELKELYQELLGFLLYLATCTRPDISFVAGVLSPYVGAPMVRHLVAAKTVLRYL